MSKAKPFVTTDLPITIKGVDCYLNIVMEKSAYLWNFAFAPEDEDIEIDYRRTLFLLREVVVNMVLIRLLQIRVEER